MVQGIHLDKRRRAIVILLQRQVDQLLTSTRLQPLWMNGGHAMLPITITLENEWKLYSLECYYISVV